MDEAESNNQLKTEIEQVLKQLQANWNSQNFATVLDLWDRDEPEPYYLAEERDEWLIGWDELNGYLNPEIPSPAVEALRLDITNVRVKQIAPDHAFAIWDLHFEMKLRGRPPLGEDVRVTGIFRKKPEGWRFIHYAEAPMATMVYIQKLFERDVKPEFDEIYQKALKKRGAR